MRITLRRAVAASALVGAAALPLQSAVGHAATPEEAFSSCITITDATYRDALIAGADYDISSAIDQCVNAFLTGMALMPPRPRSPPTPPPPTTAGRTGW